jgi:signal recognition particle receptor subunit beta
MALINYAKREIDAKIVYYGPALCGKTTNLQYIHKKLSPKNRGKLVSLATDADRTLFFDFLPIELADVMGFKTRFHAYTVPGQVYYAATRKAVLSGVDGVIFVADSQTSKLKENIESLKDLEQNLRSHGKTLKTLPFLIQYNKRDLPNIMEVAELDSILNKMKSPSHESVAFEGRGVMESLTSICKLVLKEMEKGSKQQRRPGARPAARPQPAAAPEAPPQPEPAAAPASQEPPPQPAATETAAKQAPSGDFTFAGGDKDIATGAQPAEAKEIEPRPPDHELAGESDEVEIISVGPAEKIMNNVFNVPVNGKFVGMNKHFTLNLSLRIDNIVMRKNDEDFS